MEPNKPNKAGWLSSLSPKIIKDGGSIVTSPMDISSLLNNLFISKVEKICNEIENIMGDPLFTLRTVMNRWRKSSKLLVFKFKDVS